MFSKHEDIGSIPITLKVSFWVLIFNIMKYWVDWDNCCIVFGEIIDNNFIDLSNNKYMQIPLKDVCSSLKDAETSLLSHFKNV